MGDYFVVLGLGTFGYRLAIQLQQGGADVLAIDQDETIVQRISNQVTRAVCANFEDEDILKKLGVFDAPSVVVGVPRHFETTVLVTYFLSTAKVPQILVQVSTEAEANAIRLVGATSVIFPEQDGADHIARKLLMPDLADQIVVGAEMSIAEMNCPPAFVGKSLLDLDIRKKYDVYIIGIKQRSTQEYKPDRFEIAPRPDRPFKSWDILLVLGKPEKLLEFKKEWL